MSISSLNRGCCNDKVDKFILKPCCCLCLKKMAASMRFPKISFDIPAEISRMEVLILTVSAFFAHSFALGLSAVGLLRCFQPYVSLEGACVGPTRGYMPCHRYRLWTPKIIVPRSESLGGQRICRSGDIVSLALVIPLGGRHARSRTILMKHADDPHGQTGPCPPCRDQVPRFIA